MRLIIEVERDEGADYWVVSGAEFTPLAVTHGTGATIPAALRDFAQGCEELAECVRDSVTEHGLAGESVDVRRFLEVMSERG